MDGKPAKVVKKRIRKPRGRGLRTRAGCLTCRTRHRKCDEKKPKCGPCTKSERECEYPTTAEPIHQTVTPEIASHEPHHSPQPPETERSSSSNPLRIQDLLSPALHTTDGPVAPTLDYAATNGPSLESHNILDPELLALYPDTRPEGEDTGANPTSDTLHNGHSETPHNGISPDDRVDHASVRWLDLLAADAVQAGHGFSLPTSPDYTPSHPLYPDPSYQHEQASPSAHPIPPDILERQAWQLQSDVALSPQEAILLRTFTEKIAPWLDLFDPYKHFANYATRLAMRNTGLMAAILALTARHTAISSHAYNQISPERSPSFDACESIQLYNETLHYVSTALRYTSYKQSEELLATAIMISTYEMLDSSHHNSNWQRHLKGVFWIQRSQDVNGSSTGLRRTVWWIWLTQDIWAAFRERRRCFSFWRPVVDYPELDSDELAYRSIYLLSQAVNYFAEPQSKGDADSEDARWKTDRGTELMNMLERWRGFASASFSAMPTDHRELPNGWAPIWIHPPTFAVALQVYSFAKILVCLHRPVTGGFLGYRTLQKTLDEAVATIVGIAMELTDSSFQILSAQCLFGAGLCVQDEVKEQTILSLIQSCEARTGWPMGSIQDELKQEWAKGATEDGYP